MSLVLRDYQEELDQKILKAWDDGYQNILVQLGTGGGKTSIIAWRLLHHDGCAAVLVHLNKLIEQISDTLASCGIRHGIICNKKLKYLITKEHIKKYGQSFLMDQSRIKIIAVDSWEKQAPMHEAWSNNVTLWICDEGHHALQDNKWGRVLLRFAHPACKALLFTASPRRGDGRALLRSQGGLADVMVMGPTQRWLIDQGYLVDYKCYAFPSDLKVAEAPKGKEDYTKSQIKEATNASSVIGDIPLHYLRFAAGMSGVTFTSDVDTGNQIVEAYRAAGVTAELITGNTDISLRKSMFDRLIDHTLNQIVAIDTISEGVDVPGLQCGSLARLTKSLSLWLQQIGRLLRPNYRRDLGFDLNTREGRLAAIAASDKPYAIIIDHINGFIDPELGPPDKNHHWTLNGRRKGQAKDPDDIPLKACPECAMPYPARMRSCPHCGHTPVQGGQSDPKVVDGDLELLSPEILDKLRGEVKEIDIDRYAFEAKQIEKGAKPMWAARHWKDHVKKHEQIDNLRNAMDAWAGRHHAAGRSDSEIQRGFFLRFGVDVLTAQTLSKDEAQALCEKVENDDAGI